MLEQGREERERARAMINDTIEKVSAAKSERKRLNDREIEKLEYIHNNTIHVCVLVWYNSELQRLDIKYRKRAMF